MENKFIESFTEVLEVEDRELSLNDVFREYDEWDSLAYLSVIAMLDEEYDVAFEEDKFKQLVTLGDILDEIKKQ